MAIETGNVSKLANLYSGKIAHSLCLTTANKIMRLYMSVKKQSETLKKIANFVSTALGNQLAYS